VSGFYERVVERVDLFGRREDGWREPQRGALGATLARWTLNDRERTLVSIPTGVGKTALAMAVPFLLDTSPARILLVAPSVAIREQLVSEFSSQEQLKRIAVLPEDAETPVVEEITGMQADWATLERADVVVALPNSISPVHYEDDAKPPANLFDLVVVDEAHHAPAATWRAILDHFDAPKLLLTATPRRRDGSPIPGSLIYYYPLRKALDEGFYKPIMPVLLPVTDNVTRDQADAAIAQRALELFNSEEHRTSTLLIRAGSIRRIKELQNVYAGVGLELTPLHNGISPPRRSEVISGLRDGSVRAVGVVGMLGEGFDLPSLRLAAYHDKHRSVPATLQLVGRLARVSATFPQDSVLITVADADVFPELKTVLKELYDEDADWAEVLPGILDEYIEGEQLDREFIERLPQAHAEIDPSHLEPIKRALVYELPTDWEPAFLAQIPEELKEGAPIAGGEIAYSGANEDAGLLVVVIRYTERPSWSSDPILMNVAYELHVVAHRRSGRRDRPALVLMNLDREGLQRHFEEILGLAEDARRASPERLGDYVDSLDRISVSSVGIRSTNAATRGRASYRNYMGSNVDRGLRAVDMARSALGHVMLQVRTPEGAANAGAAVEKSKLWLSRYGSLRELSAWADQTAALLWFPRRIAQGPLLPGIDRGRELREWPDSRPLAAEPYPALLGAGFELWQPDGERIGPFDDLDLYVNVDPTGTLEDVEPPGDDPLRMIGVFNDRAVNEERCVWDAEVHIDGRIVADPDLVVRRGFSAQVPLSALLEQDAPTIYFLDGSTTIGRVRYDSRARGSAFDPATLTAIDWAPVDITAETRATAADRDPPATSVHEQLEAYLLARPRVGTGRWVLCNDGTGEIADYIVIEELASGQVALGLWHAKAAGGNPGVRVLDFQEVVGQALRSRRRFVSTTIWEEIGAALAGDAYPPATVVAGSDDREELERKLGYGRNAGEAQDDPGWMQGVPDVLGTVGVVQPGLSAAEFASQLGADPIPNAAQSLRELFSVLRDMTVVSDGGDLVMLVSD
jgi:superfamily II DNA or RNA helicase